MIFAIYFQAHNQSNNLIFNADGSLTEDAKNACTVLKIDPSTLASRTLEQFKDPDGPSAQQVSDTIAKIRHQHYEEKRRAKLELLEHTIRNGILASLLTQSNLNQKTVRGTHSLTNSPSGFKSLAPSPTHRLLNGNGGSGFNSGATRTLPLSP